MRANEYRDLNGYIIEPRHRPIFDENRANFSGGYRAAVLTYCPEINGLLHISHCEKCEFFHGHIKYTGVSCASTSTNEAPSYLNKVQPK